MTIAPVRTAPSTARRKARPPTRPRPTHGRRCSTPPRQAASSSAPWSPRSCSHPSPPACSRWCSSGRTGSDGSTSDWPSPCTSCTGFGVTIGFHRLLTHGSFRPRRWLKVVLAVAGSMAFEGSAISWVSQHRRHHVYSDRPGDPHSPVRPGRPPRRSHRRPLARTRRMALPRNRVDAERWSPDLLADKDIAVHLVDGPGVDGGVARSSPSPGVGRDAELVRRIPGPVVGWSGAGLRPAPRHVEHQLDLPRLRSPAVPHQGREPQRAGCSPWCRSASRGTTRTMPSRPWRATGSTAGSSTSRPARSPSSSV